MGDLRDILGIQAPKAPTGPVLPGSKTKTTQGPPPMEPRQKKPRTCSRSAYSNFQISLSVEHNAN